MKALMGRRIDFRAVTPGRSWEATTAEAVVDQIFFGTWFPPGRRIAALDGLETRRVGTLERVGYRLELDLPDGRFLVEQQAYLEAEEGQIASMRLVCSGFVPW